jgi:gluconate 5-dehydrogenase
MIDANTFRLDGRLALVTGSSTGIGLALARGLAQAGAIVVLNGRHAERLDAACRELQEEGLAVHQRVFDVCDAVAVGVAVADIEATIGPIHVLVNNAGIARRGLFQDAAAADWRAVLSTNLDSAFTVGQAVACCMLTRKAGRIINVCSVMSTITRPGATAYAASKGGLKMLTKGMAVDLGPHGITVNGIAPGYFKTELTAPLANDEKATAWITGHTPVGRWGELEDLAPAIVFLASDGARYVNGHLLVIDGGMTATL